MRGVLIALMIAIAASPAVAQIIINPGPIIIQPPKPIMAIEFVQEAGVERWEVKLTGERWAGNTVYCGFLVRGAHTWRRSTRG